MNLPAVGQSDRKVLLALQGLVLGLPLFLGGRQPWALAAASAVVLVLLAVTIRDGAGAARRPTRRASRRWSSWSGSRWRRRFPCPRRCFT